MAWNATFYGGPLDGDIHPVIGPEYRYPMRQEPSYYFQADPDKLPPPRTFRVGSYKLTRDDDAKYVYVHENLLG